MRHVKTALALAILALAAAPAAEAASEATRARTGKKSDQPGFEREARRKESDLADQTEQSILASIDNQKMIIDLEDPSSPKYAEMVVELADYYWNLAEVYFRKSQDDSLEQAIFDAEEAGETKTLERLRAKQDAHRAERRGYQEKTIKTYRDVITRFPRTPKIDEIRYYLGRHLAEMQEAEQAVEAFTQLILKHPSSEFVPDALVNIGDHYFDLNQYQDALKLYEQVEQYPQAGVLAYSVYKQAWSHYNLGAYDLSLSKLLSVIKMAKAQHDAGVAAAIDLAAEAQNELVYPYSKIGKPAAAIAFFGKYAPRRYLDLSSRLAALYTEQTAFGKSNKLLRALIKEAQSARPDGKDMTYMVLRFQRQIVDNAHRQADKAATVAEVQELIRLFEEHSAGAPGDWLSKETSEVDTMVLTIATGYHNEYRSTKSDETLEYTQLLYDEYLRLFSSAANAYAITYNNALLMLMTGKFRAAAAEFEKVIAMDPAGQYADDAGERAVVAYLKNLQIENQDVKNEAEEDLRQRDLAPQEQGFVTAVDRWMGIIDRRGSNPETADNIPPARFAAAKILYNANRFDEAATRFGEFYDKHAGHPFWEDAARHILSAYNLAHDVDNLRRYANLFEKNSQLMETTLAGDINRIRNEFNFQECFKFEQRDEHLGAAKCFVKYSEEFPGAQKAPAAIFNAGLNYFKAKRVEKALEMQKTLYEQYSTHELAPKALYSIAEIFRETTVYDQSADVYEFFVDSYPKHKLADKALRYASIFRKTLGHYDKAVRNIERYLKAYGDPETAAQVHLDVVLIHELAKKPARVLKAVKAHLKAYQAEDPAVRLQVLAARGRALEGMKRKEKQATQSFEETVAFYKTLTTDEADGLNLKAVSAAAEAHFNLGDSIMRRARYIKLAGNEKKVQAAIKTKLELLADAKQLYESVIAYGHPGWTIAAYTQLGLAYRDLADAVEGAEVPKRIRHLEEAAEEYRTFMAEKAAPIRERALSSYQTALKIARETHWFNEWSEKAEKAIAQLDLSDRSVKEERLKPNHTRPNAGLPDFKWEVR